MPERKLPSIEMCQGLNAQGLRATFWRVNLNYRVASGEPPEYVEVPNDVTQERIAELVDEYERRRRATATTKRAKE